MEFKERIEIREAWCIKENDEMWVRQVVSCRKKEEMRRWRRRGRKGSKDMERECESFGAIEKKRAEARCQWRRGKEVIREGAKKEKKMNPKKMRQL